FQAFNHPSGSGSVTLIVAVSVCPPSSVVTVIVAAPSALAVTSPVSSTDATPSSSDANVTTWLSASLGSIVAVNCRVAPTTRLLVFGATVTPVTSTGGVLGSRLDFSKCFIFKNHESHVHCCTDSH